MEYFLRGSSLHSYIFYSRSHYYYLYNELFAGEALLRDPKQIAGRQGETTKATTRPSSAALLLLHSNPSFGPTLGGRQSGYDSNSLGIKEGGAPIETGAIRDPRSWGV
jgi:hypothetical protein